LPGREGERGADQAGEGEECGAQHLEVG
jgi:hypothetical protein